MFDTIKSMSKSAIIVLSGGMDSSVLAHMLAKEGYLLKAITFDYSQKHGPREIECAKKQSEKLSIEHRVVDLRSLSEIFGASALTDPNSPVPSGHYSHDSMKITVVPNRNMIMLSIAGAWAIASKYDFVSYAAHAGDHTIYPDCRSEFADAVNSALQLADWRKISLLRPFVSKNKAEICKLGSTLDVDFSQTWSCYRGGLKHCGHCGTCVERKEAFDLSGVLDPTIYE